jgi:hypothetical protein
MSIDMIDVVPKSKLVCHSTAQSAPGLPCDPAKLTPAKFRDPRGGGGGGGGDGRWEMIVMVMMLQLRLPVMRPSSYSYSNSFTQECESERS